MATITGTSGTDSSEGTSGSDKINTGNGDDFLYYDLSKNSALDTKDIYTGGAGIDMVVLEFTFEEWNNLSYQAELTRYFKWREAVKTNSVGEISNGLSSDFTFAFGASTLKIQMMEQLGVMVDGNWLGGAYTVYQQQGPTARDDTAAMTEDEIAVTINVLSSTNPLESDSVPDLVRDLVVLEGDGPLHGTVELVKNTVSDPSSWQFKYVANNAYYQYLSARESTTDSFQYQITDVNNKTATATVTVTVNGVNDLATISGSQTNKFLVTEDAESNFAKGKITVADADYGQSNFQSQTLVPGTFGTFSIDVDGNYTYALDNSKPVAQSLRASDVPTESFTVWSNDGTASATLVFTVQGTNDEAQIVAPTKIELTEYSGLNADNILSVSGNLLITDVDTDEAKFIAIQETKAGTLNLQDDGSYTYTLDNAKVKYLNEGSTPLTEVFTVMSLDGTTVDISFETKGVNDAATFGGDLVGSVTEAGIGNNDGIAIAQGKLTATDVDNISNKFIADENESPYGKYTIDVDGNWTFTLDNTNLEIIALGDSQSKLVNFTVFSVDNTEQTIEITVNGADDNNNPVIEGLGRSANVAELINLDHFKTTPAVNTDTAYRAQYDFMHVRTGQFLVGDSDAADQITLQSYTASEADYFGTFVAAISEQMNSEGKYVVNWTFTVLDSDIDALTQMADLSPTKIQKYSMQFSDGKGAISTEVSIKLYGENEIIFSENGPSNIIYLDINNDFASANDAVMYGGDGNNLISVQGKSIVFGQTGDDRFEVVGGLLSSPQIYGDEGDDSFIFEEYIEFLRTSYSWGGSGSDTFTSPSLGRVQAIDWIMDFDASIGGDKIELSLPWSEALDFTFADTTTLIEKYADDSHPFLSEGASYYELRAISPVDGTEYPIFNLVGNNITLQGFLDNVSFI